MLTIEECKEILQIENLSDKETELIRNMLYATCDRVIVSYIESKTPSA